MQAYVDAISGHKFQNGHANHAWLCIDLLDVLCQLAEKGHASVVWSILDYPLKHCPEILLLGIAHVNVQIYRFVFIALA
jgi:CCR4-NOT transcription complex subunit 1